MMTIRATTRKRRRKESKNSWTVPRLMEGGGVKVGGLERPGVYHPNPLRKNIKINKCIWEKRTDNPNVGDVSCNIRRRNGAPSQKGCAANGQTTKASNQSAPPQKKKILPTRDPSQNNVRLAVLSSRSLLRAHKQRISYIPDIRQRLPLWGTELTILYCTANTSRIRNQSMPPRSYMPPPPPSLEVPPTRATPLKQATTSRISSCSSSLRVHQ